MPTVALALQPAGKIAAIYEPLKKTTFDDQCGVLRERLTTRVLTADWVRGG
jgi:hypothetical protein